MEWSTVSLYFYLQSTAILIRKGIPFKHKATIAYREGRYIIVTGELYSTSLTLVNLYGPNCDSPQFFKKVFYLIPDMSQSNLIIGGDVNCVLDQY